MVVRSSSPTFGGYCHESELASKAGRELAVNGFQPASVQDQAIISGNDRPAGDFDFGFKVMGGLAIGGAGGAVVGAATGAHFGAQWGAPVLGTVGGLAIGGVVGAVIGFAVAAR